jgi:hypothetical protein
VALSALSTIRDIERAVERTEARLDHLHAGLAGCEPTPPASLSVLLDALLEEARVVAAKARNQSSLAAK